MTGVHGTPTDAQTVRGYARALYMEMLGSRSLTCFPLSCFVAVASVETVEERRRDEDPTPTLTVLTVVLSIFSGEYESSA